MSFVKSHLPSEIPVFIAGHSMGGGEAREEDVIAVYVVVEAVYEEKGGFRGSFGLCEY